MVAWPGPAVGLKRLGPASGSPPGAALWPLPSCSSLELGPAGVASCACVGLQGSIHPAPSPFHPHPITRGCATRPCPTAGPDGPGRTPPPGAGLLRTRSKAGPGSTWHCPVTGHAVSLGQPLSPEPICPILEQRETEAGGNRGPAMTGSAVVGRGRWPGPPTRDLAGRGPPGPALRGTLPQRTAQGQVAGTLPLPAWSPFLRPRHPLRASPSTHVRLSCPPLQCPPPDKCPA